MFLHCVNLVYSFSCSLDESGLCSSVVVLKFALWNLIALADEISCKYEYENISCLHIFQCYTLWRLYLFCRSIGPRDILRERGRQTTRGKGKPRIVF